MIHETAEIEKGVKLGKNINVWAYTQIREGTEIGKNCIVGRNVFIDHNIKIGSNVKIQNNALIYYKSIVENDVFIGPAASLINDKYPKATNKRGKLKSTTDWKAGTIVIKKGSSIGAGVIILPDVTIGMYSLIGAGSVVTHSVASYSKIAGNPGQLIGYICKLGHSTNLPQLKRSTNKFFCKNCKKYYKTML